LAGDPCAEVAGFLRNIFMDREALLSEGFGKLLNCWRSRRIRARAAQQKGDVYVGLKSKSRERRASNLRPPA
jgi:hypothetical protein